MDERTQHKTTITWHKMNTEQLTWCDTRFEFYLITITCNLIYWITWCKIWMIWCQIWIVLLCRWPRPQELYGLFQEIQWQYDLCLEMFWTHQSTIDEQENFTIDGSLYLASFAGNYLDAWRRDRVSTQWLSWPHIPIVSQGHYKSKIIILLQVQDYLSKIIQDYGDISKCEMKMRVRCNESEMLWWFWRSSGSMFKIGFEILKLIEEQYAKVQLS